jgi:hypothetical protein
MAAKIPTRFSDFENFEELSQWARDVQAWMRALPGLEVVTIRSLGSADKVLQMLDRRLPPIAVLLINAEEANAPGTFATPAATVGYTWRASSGADVGEIVVTSTSGLTASTSYDLTFLVVG